MKTFISKKRLIGIFILLTVLLFQFQTVFAVSELNTLSFTVYSLGGANDEMGYGNGSEWGRPDLILHAANPDSSISVSASDHIAIRFSVQNECQPFYCIEIGGHLSDLNGEDYSKNDYSYWEYISTNGKLTGDEINYYLGNILYFGFHDEFTYTDGNLWNVNYANNVDNINRYIATQILVWETVYAYRDANFNYVTWPSLNCPLDYISTSPNYDQIKYYYDYITYKIQTAANIPSYMYRSYDDAIAHPYQIPYSTEQQLYAITMNDHNSMTNTYSFDCDTQKIYLNNYGSSEYLNVSLPKHSETITKENPEVIKLSAGSGFTTSSIVTWTSSSKQNGITWGSPITVPIEGYAAFYPGEYQAPELGSIKVTKTGDAFTNTETIVEGDYELTKPIYGNINLSNVTFTLKATSDIYLDETLLYLNGTIIESKTTDDTGIVEFNNLGVGSYEISEVNNNECYIPISEPIQVYLDWNLKTNLIDTKEYEINNEYQKVTVSGLKFFAPINENISFNLNTEMQKVEVGLFAGESIKGKNGALIEEYTLIEVEKPNTEGVIEFKTELPKGKYYIKELKGSDLFIVDEEQYYIDCYCENNELVTNNFYDENGIVNESTHIIGKKEDDEGNPLKGATIGLFSDPECQNLIEIATSNEEGIFSFTELLVGKYYVKEIEAPDQYVINDEIYEVYSNIENDYTLVIVNNKCYVQPTATPTPEITPEVTPEITPEITPTITPEVTPEVTPTITPVVTPEVTPTITPEITPTNEIPTPEPTPVEFTDTPPVYFDNPPAKNNPPTNNPPITNTGEEVSITTAIGRSMLLALILTIVISKTYIMIVNKISQ